MANAQDPTDVVVIDGVPFPVDEPALVADLPGVLRGEGVFESFLVRDGRPTPFLDRHAARLRRSAGLCALDFAGRDLEREFEGFRPFVTRGRWRARFTLLRRAEGRPLRMWTAGPAPDPPDEVALSMARVRADPSFPLAAAKVTSRMAWQVERRRARGEGAFDALMTTIEGDLAECTSMNVFVLRDGELATPPLDRGILGGVTRDAVLAAAAEAGLRAVERRIQPREIAAADEVYVTNAVMGILAVRSVEGVRNGLPGASGGSFPILRAAYRSLVARAAAGREGAAT